MNGLNRLDPRTLFFVITVTVPLCLLFGGDLPKDAALALLFFFLLTAASRFRFALQSILVLVGLHVVAGLAAMSVSENSARNIWLFTVVLRKIFFIFLAANFLISTISVGDCIKSLEKMKAPWMVVLPLAICVRVLPALAYEGRIIRDALKVRGLFSARRIFRHPLLTLELFLMTLLFRVMAIGEELAFSVSTRAASGSRKTWYREKSPGMKDLLFSLLVLGTVGAILLTPWQDLLPKTGTL